jgi:hypothetical protein
LRDSKYIGFPIDTQDQKGRRESDPSIGSPDRNSHAIAG